MYYCISCNKAFVSFIQITDHVRYLHDSTPFRCGCYGLRSVSFANFYDYVRHFYIAHDAEGESMNLAYYKFLEMWTKQISVSDSCSEDSDDTSSAEQ